jgi:capsular exopolysaccharide synthesis family protein
MSRLEAALRRAATGAIVEQTIVSPPEEQEPDTATSPDTTQGTTPDTIQTAVGGSAPQAPVEVVPPPVESEAVSHEDPLSPQFTAFHSEHAEKLVVSPAMPQALREHYRRLAATLHHAQAESGVKVLMVSSAVPDEGKTLTATNLALTLSESYQRRVLLIDADLRRPSLDGIFQLPKIFGLNEALTSVPPRRVSLVRVSRHLSLLTAGAPDPDPISTLTSDRMRQLLAEAAAAFDWVIIDTPPVGILTDAKLLGSMVDAALLVIRANKTPAALIQRAVDAIGRERILGVVLNRAELRGEHGSYSYYNSYYYGASK